MQKAALALQHLPIPWSICSHSHCVNGIHVKASNASYAALCTEVARLTGVFLAQAPLLVDFRDNSNEAEIKMTLQFASTAKAQVGS